MIVTFAQMVKTDQFTTKYKDDRVIALKQQITYYFDNLYSRYNGSIIITIKKKGLRRYMFIFVHHIGKTAQHNSTIEQIHQEIEKKDTLINLTLPHERLENKIITTKSEHNNTQEFTNNGYNVKP